MRWLGASPIQTASRRRWQDASGERSTWCEKTLTVQVSNLDFILSAGPRSTKTSNWLGWTKIWCSKVYSFFFLKLGYCDARVVSDFDISSHSHFSELVFFLGKVIADPAVLGGAMAERGRRNLMDASAKASGEYHGCTWSWRWWDFYPSFGKCPVDLTTWCRTVTQREGLQKQRFGPTEPPFLMLKSMSFRGTAPEWIRLVGPCVFFQGIAFFPLSRPSWRQPGIDAKICHLIMIPADDIPMAACVPSIIWHSGWQLIRDSTWIYNHEAWEHIELDLKEPEDSEACCP